MRKNLAFLSAALLAVPLLFAACAKKPDPAALEASTPCELNVFIWSEYIDEKIVEDFKAQNQCKVKIDLYEDNESMMAKLQGGGTAQYDIVVPGNYIVPSMIKLGLLAEIRHDNVPNLANLEDRFINPGYDPGNVYTAAYQWGTVGIYLRKSKVGKFDESWGLLFDKKQQKGSFLLMDSIREMLGSVLKYKGHEVNTVDPAELQEAGAILLEAKNRSEGFEGGVGGKNKVLDKTVDMAVVYNGDAVRGMADDPDTYYFVPKEGGVLWVDNMAIPSKAPHRYWAEKFINFILDPKVGAQLSNYNQYATPNKAAMPLIKPEDLQNPAIYPSAEIMNGLQFVNDVGDKGKLYDEVWTKVKSK